MAQAKAMKELIVNGVDRKQAPPGNAGTVKVSELDVFPAELQWKAKIDGVDPSTANISTQWYYQDPQKLGWSVIPSISGIAVKATPGVTVDNAAYQDLCATCASDNYSSSTAR